MKLTVVTITALFAVALIATAGASKKCGSMCGTDGCKMKQEEKNEKAVINTTGLKALIDSKVPVVILDARTGKFDDGKRIPGAKVLDAEATDAKIAEVLPDKNALIVTYCGGIKCPASNKLAERLAALGYGNVVEYPEGIAGWVDKGNKVEQ